MDVKDIRKQEKDNSILQKIIVGDERVLTEVYKQYHDQFIFYWRKIYPWIIKEDSENIYDDCILALYRNAKSGRIEKFDHTLKSYLFAIGHNKFVDLIKHNKRYKTKNIIDIMGSEDLPVDQYEEVDPYKKRLKLIDDTIDQLTAICKTILILFWDRRISDNELLDMIGNNSMEKNKIEKETKLDFNSLSNYTSSNSIKIQRSRCMEKLKEKVLTLAVEEKIISSEKCTQLLGK